MSMDGKSSIETSMVDLNDLTFRQIGHRRREFAPAVDNLLKQVERPRINLGSGPPGRAD